MARSQMTTAVVLAAYALIACGRGPTTPTPQPTVLLNTTLTLNPGSNCTTGGASATFSPTTGKTITIVAQGTGGVNPAITLYAPNFATQLAGAQGTAGRATLSFAITQTGSHHASVCDQAGIGGVVQLTVTQPA